MAQVVVEMTGEEAKLWRAQQKIIAQTKAMEDGYRRTRKSAKDTEKSAVGGAKNQQTAFANVGRSLLGLVSGYASINTAVQLYNSYLAEQSRLSGESLSKTEELAKAQERALKNMMAIGDSEIRDIFGQQLSRIQAETRFPSRPQLTTSVGEAFGTGALSAQALESIKAAAPLTVLNTEDVGGLAKGGLDIRAAVGAGTIRENIAFVSRVGAASRVEEALRLTKNLTPAIASSLNTVAGQDRQQAAAQTAALFAELTKATSDVTGEKTKTAVATLTGKLATFYDKRKDDPGTLFGRIQHLQAEEELRKEFLGKGFGQIEFQQPFKQLLAPQSQLFAAVQATRRGLTFSEADYQTLLKRQQLTPELKIARAAAAAQANLELAVDPAQARREIIRREFETAVRQTGGGGISEYLRDTLALRVLGHAQQRPDQGAGLALGRLRTERGRFAAAAERGLAGEPGIDAAKFQRWTAIMDRAIENIEALSRSFEQLNQAGTANANRRRQAQAGGAIEAQ